MSEQRTETVRPPNGLSDPPRLRALDDLALTSQSDVDMERFARRAADLLAAPVALVSLVRPEGLSFPGLAGLGEPWASWRRAPLTATPCARVVATGEPVVRADLSRDPPDGARGHELGLLGYAGMPLTDAEGRVLGVLVVGDPRPRSWTAAELARLGDLAKDCGTELQLRLARRETERERVRRDSAERSLRAAYDRSQLLLTTSEALSGTQSVLQIRDRIAGLVSTELAPSHVGLLITEDRGAQRTIEDQRDSVRADPPRPSREAGQWRDFDPGVAVVPARAVAEGRLQFYADPAAMAADLPAAVCADYRDRGLAAVACAPVSGRAGVLGVLEFGWAEPHTLDPLEQVILSTIASYIGQALDRARFVQHRITVSHQLQEALLTRLPRVAGLDLSARYIAAEAADEVGGDWYDAMVLPAPESESGSESGSGNAGREVVSVVVGDVTGHNVHAATMMGQFRSMLRQAAWSRLDDPPSAVVHAVETGCTALGVEVTGTVLLGQLRRAEGGRWRLRWTNAGHPPPVLIHPDGRTEVLRTHDMLFGFPDLQRRPRRDAERLLEPGSLLLLYTDGLIDHPGSDSDERIAALARLAGATPGADPEELVTRVVAEFGGNPGDDLVAMAVRLDPA